MERHAFFFFYTRSHHGQKRARLGCALCATKVPLGFQGRARLASRAAASFLGGVRRINGACAAPTQRVKRHEAREGAQGFDAGASGTAFLSPQRVVQPSRWLHRRGRAQRRPRPDTHKNKTTPHKVKEGEPKGERRGGANGAREGGGEVCTTVAVEGVSACMCARGGCEWV